ncbi:hypothetical protein LCGC14_2907670 [marine sediment metagenome]|uniref:Uncharacterized protein n=1 Tax=marine sediment metagenome TaxID=412755 RepID=A0A0F9AIQ3_9ZZZZ
MYLNPPFQVLNAVPIIDEGSLPDLKFDVLRSATEVDWLLIETGADVNVQNKWGETALMWASYEGHPEVVELLIERGANINAMDSNGYTALMWALKKGQTEAINLLKEAGARKL